jgi:large subunit ribosomal protein L25
MPRAGRARRVAWPGPAWYDPRPLEETVMSTGFEIEFESRAERGKGANRRLRREGKVPGVLYGAGRDPRSITLNWNSLMHQMDKEAFYTSILTLREGDKSQPVIVKAVHRHPIKPQLLHIDFQRILEDEEITLDVPIHFIGEAQAKGVKLQGGEIQHLMTEIEISCLPRNLPEFIELDVTELELNDILHLSDIAVPQGVEFVDLSHGRNPAVVAINPPRREEEEAPVEAAVAAAPEPGAVPASEQVPDEPTSD